MSALVAEMTRAFARRGQPKLSQEEYASADREFAGFAQRHAQLGAEERARLAALKTLLFRDKP